MNKGEYWISGLEINDTKSVFGGFAEFKNNVEGVMIDKSTITLKCIIQ